MRQPGRRVPWPEGTTSTARTRRAPAGSSDARWRTHGVRPPQIRRLPAAADRPASPWQVPARGHPALCTERRLPPVQRGCERSLPVFLTCRWPRRPAQRQGTARLEPSQDPASDQIAVEPVERITDHRQLDAIRLSAKGLYTRHDRPDIPRTHGGRLGPDHFHHVRFGVHRPHLAEPPAQREGELAGPAGQIEQAPVPRDLGTPDQIGDHHFRVR